MAHVSSSRSSLPSTLPSSDYLAVLWQHLTQSMCQEVFGSLRITERQRKWTLYGLWQVWIGILENLRSSQSSAVRACASAHPGFPAIEASPSSFFQRVQGLRPVFFQEVFRRLTQALLAEVPQRFATDLPACVQRFEQIFVLDGSRLHKVGRVLKACRHITAAILPGCVEAVYDLRRGLIRELVFEPDALKGEKHQLLRAFENLPKGSLILYDRYAGHELYFREARERGLFLLARAPKNLPHQKIARIFQVPGYRASLKEYWVKVGQERLRLIEVKTARGLWRLLTNVEDRQRLPATVAASLYAKRWSVERCFLDLKASLQLNHLYNAAPNPVAQQVYVTAALYNAMRFSQAQISEKLNIPAEEISPKKLFIELMHRMAELTAGEIMATAYRERLIQKGYKDLMSVEEAHLECSEKLDLPVAAILLEKRNGKRRKRRFCKGRKRYTTYARIPGARKYVNN